ncbi:MAG: ATP-binding cassette domain-containing protein [Selenomonadaceae bacterium]
MLEVTMRKQLTDFSVDIGFQMKNEIVTFQGDSGSGKTTILRCIAGLMNPDEGMIQLNKTTFFSSDSKISMASRNRRVGYMFQDYAIFPHMSVYKNIWYGVPKKTKVKQNLYEKLLELLEIEYLAGRDSKNLSGGERQRIALARVLMTEPEVLLLDEPFSALDSVLRKHVGMEFKKIQEIWDIPYIIVTHDDSEAKSFSDRIFYLKQGHFVMR